MIMGNKPAYSLWPHSARPLRRLAGGRAPSDPRFPARRWSGGRRGTPPPEHRRRCRRRASPFRGRRSDRPDPRRTGRPRTRSVPARPSVSTRRPSPWPTGWPRSPGTVSSPENRPHGDSGRLGAGCAESEAVRPPVTHELDPRRGRSTPGFALSREELDIAAVEDRAGRVGGEARHSTGQLPGLSVVNLTDGEERPGGPLRRPRSHGGSLSAIRPPSLLSVRSGSLRSPPGRSTVRAIPVTRSCK